MLAQGHMGEQMSSCFLYALAHRYIAGSDLIWIVNSSAFHGTMASLAHF